MEYREQATLNSSAHTAATRQSGAFLWIDLELQGSAPYGDSDEKWKEETRLDSRTGS